MGANFYKPAVSAAFLASTDVVDWYHADVRTLAWYLAGGERDAVDVARRCFEWVRDEIRHSVDFGETIVTCAASDVLAQRTGFCYAKSHLLAALLRERHPGRILLPAAVDHRRWPAVLFAWAQRGVAAGVRLVSNRSPWQQIGRRCQFTPAIERLAFAIQIPGEATLPEIHSAPLDVVVETLRKYSTVGEVCENLPDFILPEINVAVPACQPSVRG